MFAIHKFPDLSYRGRRLIWDTRQLPDGRPEWVICPGDAHANAEIETQLKARAAALVVGPVGSGASLEVADPRRFLGEAAALALGEPSRQLRVLGVTGTNGKTTSTLILGALFRAVGRGAVAEIGTLGLRIFKDGALLEHVETGFTTPEAPTLHRIFADLLALGVETVVMEVSSHAVELGRIGGTDFDGAVFTNLTQDHLDFHGTMAAYERAKERLFADYLARKTCANVPELRPSAKSRLAVLNTGDPAGLRILAALPLGLPSHAFARGKNLRVLESTVAGTRFVLEGETFASPLVGEFNVENLAGAILLLKGLSPDSPAAAVNRAVTEFSGARGRLERVAAEPRAGRRRQVFVDYAHTPDALDKAAKTLRDVKDPGAKLFVVFGCGGDRDRGKRPQMGRIAQDVADFVYVTSDNPRTENPAAILTDIVLGMDSGRANFKAVTDRKEAITECLTRMGERDVCLVAGKGHEDYQIVGTQKLPFSDFDVVRAWMES